MSLLHDRVLTLIVIWMCSSVVTARLYMSIEVNNFEIVRFDELVINRVFASMVKATLHVW